ncbi:MAG: transketolase C-terminal domain-containing protein, partial [Chloroflexota bacterium]|nr:transketolase C-terminal domain-containing protein [Chloroflexota bacterium]
TQGGGGRGNAAQHSQSLEMWYVHVPGLVVIQPSTPYDAKGLLAAAIRDNDPVIFFEHKLLYGIEGEVPEDNYVIPLGVADVKREGKDLTIVTMGRMVHFSLEAAEKLTGDGVDVEVVDLRSLSPMDEDAILNSVKKTHRLIVVDEDFPRCNMATDVVALVAGQAFDYLDAPPTMITPPHTPVPFSPVLEDAYLPSVDDIVATAQSLM